MKKKNKNKKFLAILILVLGVGFAFITSTLAINGNTGFGNTTFAVSFSNFRALDSEKIFTSQVDTITEGVTTEFSYSVHLPEPGDVYKCLVDVVNTGTTRAMVNIATLSSDGNNNSFMNDYAEFKVSYLDGNEITEKDFLGVGERKTIIMSVRYREDIPVSIMANDKDDLDITVSLEYKNASKDAIKERDIPSKLIVGETFNKKIKEMAGMQRPTSLSEVNYSRHYLNNDYFIEYNNGVCKSFDDANGVGHNEDMSLCLENLDGLLDSSFSFRNNHTITDFKRTYELPDEYRNEDYIVSTEDSIIPIYAWIDGTTVNMYTEAPLFMLNEDSYRMFANFDEVKEFKMYDFNTMIVADMQSMFEDCTNVRAIYFQNKIPTPELFTMSWTFANCPALQFITMKNITTDNLIYMDGAFNSDSNLFVVEVDENFSNANLIYANNVFTGCVGLRGKITYDSTKTSTSYANLNGYFVTNAGNPY